MSPELMELDRGVGRSVVTRWVERIDFEGRDLVALEKCTVDGLVLSARIFLIARQ